MIQLYLRSVRHRLNQMCVRQSSPNLRVIARHDDLMFLGKPLDKVNHRASSVWIEVEGGVIKDKETECPQRFRESSFEAEVEHHLLAAAEEQQVALNAFDIEGGE